MSVCVCVCAFVGWLSTAGQRKLHLLESEKFFARVRHGRWGWCCCSWRRSIPRFDNTFDMFASPKYSEAAIYMYNTGKAAETFPISCPAIEAPWPQEIFSQRSCQFLTRTNNSLIVWFSFAFCILIWAYHGSHVSCVCVFANVSALPKNPLNLQYLGNFTHITSICSCHWHMLAANVASMEKCP